MVRHEKIIVIRCFETEQTKIFIYIQQKRVKCLILQFLNHLRSHLQTKSHIHTHKLISTPKKIRVFTTDHIVYTYIYSILLVVKEIKTNIMRRIKKQTKNRREGKKCISKHFPLLFECYCFQPAPQTQKTKTKIRIHFSTSNSVV